MTVVTVHAASHRVLWRECAENAVVPLPPRRVEKSQQLLHVLRIPYAGQNRHYPRLVKGVLNALISGERFSKRRSPPVQKLSAGKGLHDGNPNPFRLASPVESHSLIRTALCIFAVSVIISGIDGKHKLFRHLDIQYRLRQRRGMGGKPDMPDHSLSFHIEQIFQHSVFLIILPVRRSVKTMDKAVVHIVCFQLPKHPLHLVFHFVQPGRPAVFACLVVGPEMNLIEHFLPEPLKSLSVISEGLCPGGCKVGKINSVRVGKVQSLHRFLLRRLRYVAGSQTNHADTVPGFFVYPVLQSSLLSFPLSSTEINFLPEPLSASVQLSEI